MRGKWKTETGWKAQATALLHEAFPQDVTELSGPLYFHDCRDLPAEFDLPGVAAFTAPCLDLKLRPHIAKWQGRGFACVVRADALSPRKLLASAVHEFCHHMTAAAILGALDQAYFLAVEPAEMTAAQRSATDRITGDFWRSTRREAEPWQAHDQRFIWACIHACYRVWQLADFTSSDYLVNFGGERYALSPKLDYLKAAGWAPREMINEPLLSVISAELPREFTALFESDCQKWRAKGQG